MFLKMDTKDIDDFVSQLSANINGIAQNAQHEWMQSTVGGIMDAMQERPPETDANRPPPPYYLRGSGRVLRGGRLLFSSGQLSSNWVENIAVSSTEVTGLISNITEDPITGNVYSSYVHGVPGMGRRGGQASFHTQRGWPSLLNVTLAAVGETRANVVYSGGLNLVGSPEEIGNKIAREIERLG